MGEIGMEPEGLVSPAQQARLLHRDGKQIAIGQEAQPGRPCFQFCNLPASAIFRYCPDGAVKYVGEV
jgi:hypothetical protein